MNHFEFGLFQATLKVNRAYRHLQEIEACIERLTKADAYEIFEEVKPESGRPSFRLKVPPLPPDLPLSIGDCIHNLNCALDYIATAIMRALGKDVNRIIFPSDETRSALKATFKKPAQGKRRPRNRAIVEACHLFALLLLCKIKPYRGGKYMVWEIRKADNLDKHNLIIPTISIVEIVDIAISDKNDNRVSGMTIRTGPGQEIGLAQMASAAKVDNYGRPIFSITFPQRAEVFAGESVLPKLVQCIHSINEVIKICQAHLAPSLSRI